MRDSAERLRDIVEAIAAIERHSHCEKQAFERDELLQTWFVRHRQIIGKAARAIPEEIRALAPGIPWHQIAGMRNVLVHGYFEVDTDLVWDAATREVPALKPAIGRLLATLNPASE
ncbi:MAG: HepT-like ribonuclease domain-containing protein [Terracidiphilus sp.]